MQIWIETITCVVPSTGSALSRIQLSTLGGILGAATGLAAGFVMSEGLGVSFTVSPGAVIGLLAARGFYDFLSTGPDDLYVKVNGVRTLPKSGTYHIPAKETHSIRQYAGTFTDTCVVELWDHDTITRDDLLGSYTFHNPPAGWYKDTIWLQNPKKGSYYEMVVWLG